jgi:hypothetical protein
MCCGEEMHGRHAGHIGDSVHHMGMAHGMCGCGYGGRRFLSKKERIEMLKEYSESLKCELEGVEEELKELREE